MPFGFGRSIAEVRTSENKVSLFYHVSLIIILSLANFDSRWITVFIRLMISKSTFGIYGRSTFWQWHFLFFSFYLLNDTNVFFTCYAILHLFIVSHVTLSRARIDTLRLVKKRAWDEEKSSVYETHFSSVY